MDHKKPGSPGDILKHHGVKGQKWGIRKKDDRGSGDGKDAKDLADHNAQTKAYMAAAKQMPDNTPQQSVAKYKENQKKFTAKFEASEAPPTKGPLGTIEGVPQQKEPRLTPGQKKALVFVGGSAAVVGGMYLAGKYLDKNPDALLKLFNLDLDTTPQALGLTSFDEIERLAGKPISPTKFHGLVGFSQGKTWFYGNDASYLTDSAFARKAFELPAGHTFYRLSTKAEEGFKDATYATHSIDDFNRYVSGFRQEKGLGADFHRITWQAKEPVKVPDLTTVLGSLHSALSEESITKGSFYKDFSINEKMVMREYQAMSGGEWSTPLAKKLIEKLKAQGYSAIVDEMDAGVIGETPLVFFGVDRATPKTAIKFDSKAISRAEKLLKEISNPPGRKY